MSDYSKIEFVDVRIGEYISLSQMPENTEISFGCPFSNVDSLNAEVVIHSDHHIANLPVALGVLPKGIFGFLTNYYGLEPYDVSPTTVYELFLNEQESFGYNNAYTNHIQSNFYLLGINSAIYTIDNETAAMYHLSVLDFMASLEDSPLEDSKRVTTDLVRYIRSIRRGAMTLLYSLFDHGAEDGLAKVDDFYKTKVLGYEHESVLTPQVLDSVEDDLLEQVGIITNNLSSLQQSISDCDLDAEIVFPYGIGPLEVEANVRAMLVKEMNTGLKNVSQIYRQKTMNKWRIQQQVLLDDHLDAHGRPRIVRRLVLPEGEVDPSVLRRQSANTAMIAYLGSGGDQKAFLVNMVGGCAFLRRRNLPLDQHIPGLLTAEDLVGFA